MDQNFSISFTVSQSPAEVFSAINNVRGWWSHAIEGDTDKPDSEFRYSYRDIHRTHFKIIEFIPNQKVVWHVLENYFNFTEDKREWTDTKISFELSDKDGATELRFTHIGLVPHYECYNVCTDGWGTYIRGSLHSLITTGAGNPNVGDAITESEQMLS